jgi:hypothetical protein
MIPRFLQERVERRSFAALLEIEVGLEKRPRGYLSRRENE